MQLLDVRGIQVAGDEETTRANIVSALGRRLPELSLAPLPHDGTFVLCGSGPSLQNHLGEIRAESGPVVAVKGAHDYLLGEGIQPDAYVSIEVRERPVKPMPGTVYFLASRCPPQTFDAMQGHSVVLFHTWDGKAPVPELNGKPLLTGGSTSGLRAVSIGYALGFRKFVMYGFDSCLASDGKTKRITGEIVEEEKSMYVHCAGRAFKTNGAMALQAQDFRDMIRLMRDCVFDVKGDGLIAAIYREFLRMRSKAA